MSASAPDLPPDAVAWESIARGYASYWVPRFQPFLAAAVAALQPGPGPLLVPGCGPGAEAIELARRFPDRRVLATDPAPAMLAELRATLARDPAPPPNLELAAAPAEDTRALGGPAGGVLSTFALQLLRRREETLAAWARALHRRGRIVALFWPQQPPGSSWARLGEAMQAVTGEPRPAWEDALRAALPGLGLRLQASQDVQRAIPHPDPQQAFERLVDACSLRGLLLRHGPQAIAAVRARWLADPALERTPAGWVQRPVARLWLLAPRREDSSQRHRDAEERREACWRSNGSSEQRPNDRDSPV